MTKKTDTRLTPKTMTAEKVEQLFKRQAPSFDIAIDAVAKADGTLLDALSSFGALFSRLDDIAYDKFIAKHIKTLWPENNNTDKGKRKEAKIVIIWASRRKMPEGVNSLQGAYREVNSECREKYCTTPSAGGGKKKKKKQPTPPKPTITFLEALKKNTGLDDELARQFISMTKSDKWQEELALWVVESFAEYEKETAA